MILRKKGSIILFVSLLLAALLLVALITQIVWENRSLELNSYRVISDRLPKAFDGFRIAQVSDLHNTELGKDNEKLLSMLSDAEPDMIAITGDMIDSRNTNVDRALAFAKEAVQIAPCYYVTGNHEAWTNEYSRLKEGLTALGVTVLEDAKAQIILSEESITLVGVADPDFQTAPLLESKLDELISDENGYTILLSHRPERFQAYARSNVDLVLSGHAHGGQFRLPLIGGIFAPDQGLFPKYDGGIYTEGNTNMVVSRGIGNSIIPFRINNRPEVVLIELAAP